MIRNLSAPLSSWSNGVAQDFTVRSKSYKQNGLKESSSESLYVVTNFQVIEQDNIETALLNMLPTVHYTTYTVGSMKLPSDIFLSIFIPSKHKSFVRKMKMQKKYALIVHAHISAETIQQISISNITPSMALLSNFLQGLDSEMYSRLKLIINCININDLSGVLSSVKLMEVKLYNGKPLICKAVNLSSVGNIPYIQIPGTTWNAAQKTGIIILFHHLSDMVLNIGFTLEGKKDDELPEQIFCCTQLNHYDL